MGQAAEGAGEAAQGVGDTAGQAVEGVGDAAGNAAGQATEQAGVVDQGADQGRRMLRGQDGS